MPDSGVASSVIADIRALSRREQIGLVLFLLIAVFINADQQALAPNLVAIQTEFGVTDFDIGVMTGTFFVVGALIGVLLGRGTDTWRNRKLLLLVVILLDEIPCLLTAFVRTYEQLFVVRVLTGLGIMGSFPLLYAVFGDYFRRENRNFGNAVIGVLYTLGIVLGQLVAGAMGPVYGWRAPFLALSLPNFAFAILFFAVGDLPQRGGAEAPIREKLRSGAVLDAIPLIREYTHTMRRPAVAFAIIQGIFGSIAGGMLALFMAKHFQTYFGWSVPQSVGIVTIMALGGLAGSVFGGYAGGRLYRRAGKLVPLFCAGTTLSGALLIEVLLSLSPQTSQAIVGTIGVAASALIFMTIPNLKAVMTNLVSPEQRGIAFSLLGLTDDLGQALGPLFGGSVTALGLSLASALKIGAAIWIPCAALWFMIAWKYESGERAADVDIDRAASLMRTPTTEAHD
ncbi:MAG: MFS transporter [Gemmatimonadaceae bacterium]